MVTRPVRISDLLKLIISENHCRDKDSARADSDIVLDLGFHMQPFGKEFMQMVTVQCLHQFPVILSVFCHSFACRSDHILHLSIMSSKTMQKTDFFIIIFSFFFFFYSGFS